MEHPAADLDRDLIAAQEAFVRADRRGDMREADSQLLRLAALYDERAHLPLQRTGT